MKKYMINALYVDGYERFAVIKGMDYDVEFTVHFLDCEEYVEAGSASQEIRVGDVLEGKISVDLVTVSQKTDEEVMHRQTIEKSPHVEAVVYVYQVVDAYSIYAISSIANEKILIEFEDKVNYREGDRIYIEGSMEMTLANG